MGLFKDRVNIVIAVHVVFNKSGDNYGPGHTISDFLRSEGKRHILIKHPLYGKHKSIISVFQNGGVDSVFCGLRNGLLFPLQILCELFINLNIARRHVLKNGTFIGIDPVNALAGYLLLKAGRIKKLVFYTADYAVKRFENPALNYIYHTIDRIVARNSDFVWNVSSRIVNERKKQGIPEYKNILVPNSPDFDSIKRRSLQEVNRHSLIIMSVLNKSQNLPIIFEMVDELKSRFPKIKLTVIGSGEEELSLKELAKRKKLENDILFLGAKSHDEAMQALSLSGIGLAIYTGGWAWNYFGDSKKVREYLASGLPVIMTDIPSTADDVRLKKAGFVVNLNKEEIKNAVFQLLNDDKLYFECRENAIALAKEFDSKIILKQAFGKIYEN